MGCAAQECLYFGGFVRFLWGVGRIGWFEFGCVVACWIAFLPCVLIVCSKQVVLFSIAVSLHIIEVVCGRHVGEPKSVWEAMAERQRAFHRSQSLFLPLINAEDSRH